MNEDGVVVIGTDLNESPLEKKLRKLESKLKREEVNLEIKLSDVDNVKKDLEEIYNETKKLSHERMELNKQLQSKESQYKTLNERITNKETFTPEEFNRFRDLPKQIEDLKGKQSEVSKETEKYSNEYEKVLEKLSKAEVSYDRQKEKVEELNQDILETKGAIAQANAEQKKGNFDLKGIGNSIEGIVKKVAKWGLAVFGVRSAYMFIRQAISTLSQYDDKLATDIQYIRWILATTLKPIIETIVNLAYKLISYIIYIGKAWGLISKSADFSAKSFQKVNKGVKDTNKSAQKLQKTLAGFDEMNILQENGSVGTGGGGGGVGLPTQDLAELDKIKVPHWIEVLAENGETIKNLIIGIGQAFLTWKLVKWASELGVFTGNVSALATMLKVAGIVAIVIGITNAIQDIITFIGDPTWNNFYKIIEDISLALVGLGAILVGINTSNPFGWITLAIGGLGLLVSAIGKSSEAEEDLAKKTKTVAEAEEDLENAREARTNASKKYTQAIKDEERTLKELEKAEKKNKISGEALHKEILIGTKNYKDLKPAEREVYDAYLEHLSASEKLTKATEDMTTATWDEKQAHHELTGAVYNEREVYDDWFQTMIDGYRNNSIEAGEMANAMKTAMNEMSDTARRDFINNLPDDIRNAFNYAFDGVVDSATETTIDLEKTYIHFKDGMEYSYKELGDTTKKFKTESQKVASGFGTIWSNASSNIQKSIDKIKSLLKLLEKLPLGKTMSIAIQNKLGIGNYNAKGAIYYPPKLAVGGIINQPGRGVPLAMGGERGAEGVIPLTDSQQMQRLGEAIGRYITVNANIVNTMNGRVISRELKQIENDENFAFNGG